MLDTFVPGYINAYAWEQMQVYEPDLAAGYGNVQPFFPVYDNQGGESTWGNKPYAVYDVMNRFQMSPFYPIKREHLLYSIRGTIEGVYAWRDFLSELLDRGDDSAKEINDFICINYPTARVRLHDTRTFSMEFARDTTKRASVTNTNYFVAELVVDYRFHINSLFNE